MTTIDGVNWSNVTIDGNQVQEITIDGQVAWTAIPDPVFYGFEDMSPWTTYGNGGQNNNRVRSGSYSYYSNDNGPGLQAEATPFPNGKQIPYFTYSYNETGNSHGHGLRLVNSNGDYEGGTGTDNPQFVVDFNSGISKPSGGGSYDEWVEVFHSFDWENNQVTVSRTGSDPFTETYTLKQGVDISKVELWNYNWNGDWQSNDNIDSWWDDVNFLTEKVIVETFEDSSLSSNWTSSNNFYPNKTPAYTGNNSCGSRSNGSVSATWEPLEKPTEINTFEYKWWEDQNQTGHVVILEDENNNEIMESGTENPQWYLNNGSGGRYQVYGGDGYNEWTRFKFTFDWENGTYDYRLENTSTGTMKTGTEQMDNNSPVDHIRFTGDGYGTADFCLFDNLIIT